MNPSRYSLSLRLSDSSLTRLYEDLVLAPSEDDADPTVFFGGLHDPAGGYANLNTGGEGSLTQWVHCEFVVSFEAVRPVITQQVCSEFF